MIRTLLMGVLFVAALARSGACALPVHYGFTGTVNFVFGNPFFGLSPQLGDPVHGHFQYQPSVADDWPQPELARYRQALPSKLEIVFGGVRFSTEGDFFTYVQNNNSGFDAFQAAGGITVADDGDTILVNGSSQPGTVEIVLGDNTSTAWDTDALPMAFDLADFTSAQAEIYVMSGIPSGVTFTISNLYIVPEPASGLLLVVAALLLPRRSGSRSRWPAANHRGRL